MLSILHPATLLSVLLVLGACTTLAPGEPAQTPAGGQSGNAALTPYFAAIEIVPAQGDDPVPSAVTGHVFHDTNRDGIRQADEKGVAGVLVSNGLDIVSTDPAGAYTLPVRDDMSVSVVQPSGWRTPTDENWVPQFAYEHKPAGTPKPFRFGGLPPTGPLPAAINFPLIPVETTDRFGCAVFGDTQTYSNAEISHARDSAFDDVVDLGPGALDCAVFVGDVMGDDLGLIPRFANVAGAMGLPQYWAHGNHDFDYDADYDRDSADTWRRLWGPNYYAFEIGKATFIVLDNVVYPCGAEDARTPGREFCLEGETKRYNARLTQTQLTWVKNLLARTDPERRLVFVHHIPFVSFVDQTAAAHQTDNVAALYALVGDRPALSLAGHTHTIENHLAGDAHAGWQDAVGIDALPFQHIIAGAVSGSWWNGDYDVDGAPMSLQRLGGPKGWLRLDFDGTAITDTYLASQEDPDRRMWLSLNTPGFRSWFEAIMGWRAEDQESRDPVPPVNANDLPDLRLLTPEDLAGGVHVAANIWNGTTETEVAIQIGNGPVQPMARSQAARGEEALIGAAYADPFAAVRQLSVGRFAQQSRSGVDRHQGFEAFRGARFGPAAPQPQGAVADRSLHLWRFTLPEDLDLGTHVATITATDRHGRTTIDRLIFEVREERPSALWRQEIWNAFEDGPPVR